MKRYIAAILVCTLLLGCGAFAAAEAPLYLALGDSITRGYGLETPETDCFAAQLADRWGMQLSNRAVDGKTSRELFDELQRGDYDAELARAAVVTVNIGSNDLLGPFLALVMESMGLSSVEQAAALTPLQMLAGLSALMTALQDPAVLAEFDAAVEDFFIKQFNSGV